MSYYTEICDTFHLKNKEYLHNVLNISYICFLTVHVEVCTYVRIFLFSSVTFQLKNKEHLHNNVLNISYICFLTVHVEVCAFVRIFFFSLGTPELYKYGSLAQKAHFASDPIGHVTICVLALISNLHTLYFINTQPNSWEPLIKQTLP